MGPRLRRAHPLVEQCSWEKREGGLVSHGGRRVEAGAVAGSSAGQPCASAGPLEKAEFTVAPRGSPRHPLPARPGRTGNGAWSAAVEAYLPRPASFSSISRRIRTGRRPAWAVLAERLSEEARAPFRSPPRRRSPCSRVWRKRWRRCWKSSRSPAEGYTLNELSHLSFNPSPPVHGGSADPSLKPRVRRTGSARFASRAGVVGSRVRTWLEPDPSGLPNPPSETEMKPFDLDAFCSLSRRSAGRPAPRGPRSAETALTPADVYRVVWRVPEVRRQSVARSQ
jgi:hypothetical protein